MENNNNNNNINDINSDISSSDEIIASKDNLFTKIISILKKALPITAVALGLLFYFTYFVIYYDSGAYTFRFRWLFLIATFCLFAYYGILIYCAIKDKNWFSLIIPVLGIGVLIYMLQSNYFFYNPKYIRGNSQMTIYFQIGLTFVFINQLIEMIRKKNYDLRRIVGYFFILVFMVMAIYMYAQTDKRQAYDISIYQFFYFYIGLYLLIADGRKMKKIINYWGIFFVCFSIFAAAYIGKEYMEIAEVFNIATFLTFFAGMNLLMFWIERVNKPTKISEYVELQFSVISFILIIIVFIGFRTTQIRFPSDMVKVNVYRVLLTLPVVFYMFNELIDEIKTKRISAIVIASLFSVLSLVFIIISFTKLNALAYKFFSGYFILAIILFVGVGFVTFYNEFLKKKIKF